MIAMDAISAIAWGVCSFVLCTGWVGLRLGCIVIMQRGGDVNPPNEALRYQREASYHPSGQPPSGGRSLSRKNSRYFGSSLSNGFRPSVR